MGKIFKITGTFYKKDEVLGPDFTGEIVVFRNNHFVGRIDQNYEFVCGTFGDSILLLSNKEGLSPTLYLMYKVDGNAWTGTQYALETQTGEDRSFLRGTATIKVEEVEFNRARAKELRRHYKNANLRSKWNDCYTTRRYSERISIL